jgi:hypothetical protein
MEGGREEGNRTGTADEHWGTQEKHNNIMTRRGYEVKYSPRVHLLLLDGKRGQLECAVTSEKGSPDATLTQLAYDVHDHARGDTA